METEIIEPDPILIEYVQLANALWTGFDNVKLNSNHIEEFILQTKQQHDGEWHYIMSNIEQNIFLLKRLDELSLLQNKVSICDAGIGLGSALFDLYLQSKKIKDKQFIFSGVEKCKKYCDYFNDKLSHYWNGDLNYIEMDIMEHDFSNYNIVYSYSPFISPRTLLTYYTKLKDDIKPGSLIIENREKGLGLDSVLTQVEGLESIKIDDIYIFRKK
jgi:hypothetical protein